MCSCTCPVHTNFYYRECNTLCLVFHFYNFVKKILICRILAFRLASSDETRLADSFQSFTNTLNDMCFSCMEQLIAVEVKCLSTLKQSGVPLQDTYNYLVRLVGT